MQRNRLSARCAAYTLVEAMVACIVLMIGISAASRLSLALLTQDEMNQRASTAFTYQESVARLYQMGFDEAEIRQLVPADPVIESLTITPSTPAVAGLGTIQAATITVSYRPSPATQSWTAHTFTSGDKNAVRTVSVTAYRSGLSATVN